MARLNPRQWIACLPLLLLSGCGGRPSSPDVSDLIVRTPQVLVHTPGLLEPSHADQWEQHGGRGWALWTQHSEESGELWVPSSGTESAIFIEAGEALDRTVTLRGWAFGQLLEDGETLPVSTRFNGIQTTELEMDTAPRDYELVLPAEMWRQGRNELSFQTPRQYPLGNGTQVAFALGRVTVSPSEEILVSPRERRLFMPPGTRAAWRLELTGSSSAKYHLRSTAGEGMARLSVRTLDPGTGETTPVFPPRSVQVGRRGQEGSLPLNVARNMVVELELAWEQSSAGQLEVAQLDLYEPGRPARPPIVFLSIDTLSARNMSLYGYDRKTTPNLERFAMDAVVFDMARSNAPWTIPSYVSQFSGQFPSVHSNEFYFDVPAEQRLPWNTFHLSEKRWTMVEVMKASGYRTGAFVDNMYMARVPGFDQGFDIYDATATRVAHQDPEGGMRMVLPQALEFLEDGSIDLPPFCFAQILDVHGPYLPQEPFAGRFEEDARQREEHLLPVVPHDFYGGIPENIAQGRLSEEEESPERMNAELFVADYDEKILEMDSVVGAFLDELRERGLYDQTLIVFSADHGEAMIDHDIAFRHSVTYDSTIHVPLIIKFPNGDHAGERVSEAVQLIDLYPTLAEVLGLSADRPYLHGKSLLPRLNEQAWEARTIYSYNEVNDHVAIVEASWKLVMTGASRSKLDEILTNPSFQRRLFDAKPKLWGALFGEGASPPIPPNVVKVRVGEVAQDPQRQAFLLRWLRRSGPIIELFDLENDPDELVDRSEEHPEIVERLQMLLEQQRERERLAMELVREEELRFQPELSPEAMAELRALGYLGED